MRIRDVIVNEGPLPSDWDADVYKKTTPFKKRLDYAKARAKQIGSGSSRVAFIIPYEGRNTVLKIAKNRKGMAQNYEEAQLLNDYILAQSGMFIPLIDHDEVDEDPTWLHTEYAEKMTSSKFEELFDCDISNLVYYVKELRKQNSSRPSNPERYIETGAINLENDYTDNFIDIFASNYNHLNIDDYRSVKNWGIYQGKPVIIDAGYSDDVSKLYGFK